jgi:hypothetical protein
MTLDDVYRLMMEATIVHPITTKKCEFPQAFAVIEHLQDMDAANIRKTIDDYKKGYFFSRRWAASNYDPNSVVGDFPLVAVRSNTGEISKMSEHKKILQYEVTLGCYDTSSDDCIADPTCVGCGNRNFHEIERDTEKILLTIIDYLSNIVKASVDGDPEDYYNKDYLTHIIGEGSSVVYTNKNVDVFKNFTGYFRRFDAGVDNLKGTEITFTFSSTFCAGTPEYNFEGFTPTKSVYCCGNN